MRLTLRTLLAWLDDTLPPSEVREIGKQVSESPLARELVDRIHRVTRQRRHTVPGKSGPDATDPNLVAGYVDNDLEPDQVAEYEKKCLTSDVNLAEAACVHQILSLLGQKVQVPAEAKARMYQLVRGRESIPPPRSDRASPRLKEPVTRPIQPWVAPEPPRRHWVERFGPVAGCLALLAILSWSAYQSLTPIGTENTSGTDLPSMPSQPQASAVPVAAQEAGNGAGEAPPPIPSPTEAPSKDLAAANPAPAAEGADGATKTASKPEPVSARAVPSGAVGVVDKAGGMLLRFNGDKREWERIGDGTSLAASDRLLSLEPFRSRIVIAKTPITLIGETHLRVSAKATADAPAFDLAEGRVLVHETAGPPAPLKVEFAGRTVTIDRPSQGAVGLERVTRWSPGQPPTQAPPLAIHGAAGDLKLAVDQAKETLAGAGTVLADASGRLQARPDATIPAWMTDPDPSPKDQQLGEQFLQQFSPDRPVLAELVGATESDSPVTKKLAIFAIKALGDLSLLTPILSKGGDPIARQSTATALRDLMSLGPQGGKLVREQLDAEFGDQTGSVIDKLLIGNTPEDASKPETLQRLVELLSPRDHPLVVRELALENLKAITGRGNEGYDPEKPDDKGWNAWKSLLTKGELKPATKRKAAG